MVATMNEKTLSAMELHQLTANAIRALSMDAVQKANSGHPGMPMGMADVATALWSHFLKFDPAAPDWPDRDRFVLSAGHGSMLLYSLLHLSGFDVSIADLKQFRQWHSRTPGHPEVGHTPGVETTTGPLGQGIATAVGMAAAEQWLAAQFNRPEFEIVNHRTYVIAGDGDLMEGISHEAGSLAGHLGLGRLIVLYDDNQISIDGPTSLSFSEDVLKRYEAYGWHVLRVDGHDPSAVSDALDKAVQEEKRPSLIACRTTIGFGSPNRGGTAKAHGEPLGEAEIRLTREQLGWQHPPFTVPQQAYQLLNVAAERGSRQRQAWQQILNAYQTAHPKQAAAFKQALQGQLPEGWEQALPTFENKPMATRNASGTTLAALMPTLPTLLGGSADLTGSNKTKTADAQIIQRDAWNGRYMHYGVREHGMGAMMNGMALHGGVIPFGGTFLVFSDYMRPAIRLAAMMRQQVIYVFTHDSIGLGEDGPTHQPVEQLTSLRLIPNLTVIRPADGGETAAAWQAALQRKDGPTALILTRQKLPQLDKNLTPKAEKGAYILIDMPNPKVILIGSGSEVHIAVAAQAMLAKRGIPTRVVSMPSWELFAATPPAYQNHVLPPEVTAKVAIEAGSPLGWERYVGQQGRVIGIKGFGASAPYQEIYKQYRLTAAVVEKTACEALQLTPSEGHHREFFKW